MIPLKYIILLTVILLFIILILIFPLKELSKQVDFEKYAPFNSISGIQTSTGKINSDIPQIEASVGCYPLASRIVERTIDFSAYNDELTHFSTTQVCQNMIDYKTDIVIVSEMTPSQKDILINDDKIEIVPIAKEALVFYVNKINNIESLTVEEIQKIYNEEITNWNELGGKNLKIHPYQLGKNSGGSEACFSTIVKNNSSSNKESNIAYDMKNIIDLPTINVGGIGYAFNMFYSKMYLKNSLKIVKINGIEPSFENITQGKYPFMFNLYFLYRNDTENPNIQKILDWILSEEGQNVIKECGLQPIN